MTNICVSVDILTFFENDNFIFYKKFAASKFAFLRFFSSKNLMRQNLRFFSKQCVFFQNSA